MRRVLIGLGVALVLAAGAAAVIVRSGSGDEEGVAGNGGAAEMTDEVTIDDFEFMPAELSVQAGAEVTVTNVDTAAHTLSADDGGDFDTGAIQAGGDEATLTIDEPGSYPFICEFHPTMTGTVTAVE